MELLSTESSLKASAASTAAIAGAPRRRVTGRRVTGRRVPDRRVTDRRVTDRATAKALAAGNWASGGRWLRAERGSATAEYAIATMAAVGFAGLLVVIMRGNEVRAILTDLVHRALTFAG